MAISGDGELGAWGEFAAQDGVALTEDLFGVERGEEALGGGKALGEEVEFVGDGLMGEAE